MKCIAASVKSRPWQNWGNRASFDLLHISNSPQVKAIALPQTTVMFKIARGRPFAAVLGAAKVFPTQIDINRSFMANLS